MVQVYEVTIKSPAGAPDETFRLIKCSDDQIKDENRELYDCLNFILFDVKELSENKVLLNTFASVTWTSWKSVSAYCELYNSCISVLRDKWAETGVMPEFYNRRAKTHQLKYILANCYNRAIEDPDKLNQYPPFSPQVYGETSFELIAQMIETVSIGSEDTFIDLGSGVGQVVLQVAASCDVKFSYGIEKADYPAHCAVRLDNEFRRWMAFYGKKYQPYVLEQGDFLSDECTEKIVSSTVIFANNFAFGPEVDHQLKLRFANLKEGAKVIASKAFCSLNFRITDRKLDDIGSIMHVTCLNPIHDAVSWTDKPFSYYVHTIDRSSLEQYFARLKNPRLKNGDQNGAKKERRSRGSTATTNSTDASQAGSTTSSVCESNGSQKPQGRRRKSKKTTKSRTDLLPSVAGSCGSPHCTPDGFCVASSSSISSSSCDQSEECSRSSFASTTHAGEEDEGLAKPLPCLRLSKCEPALDTDPVSQHGSRRTRDLHCSTSDGHRHHHRTGLVKSSSSTCNLAASSSSTTCEPRKCPDDDTTLDALRRRTVENFEAKPSSQGLTWSLKREDVGEQRRDSSLPYPDQPVPLALSQHLELTKQVFMRHFSQMRTPAYAERVRAELERERLRQTQLLEHVSELEETIKQMHAHGFELLTAFTKKLGFLVTSPTAFFSEARKLIKQHRDLEEKIAELRTEISRLSEINKDLIRRYQVEAAHLHQELQRVGPPPLLPTPPDEYYYRHHHHHHHHHHSKSKRQHPPRLVPETDPVAPSPKATRVSDSPPPPSLAAYPPPPNLSPVTKPANDPLPQRSDLTSNMISNSYLASGVPLLPVRKRHYLSEGGGLEQCPPHADSTPPLKTPRIF